jgi:LytS/YehU family sensor histidine kinase
MLTPLDQLRQVALNKLWQTLVELISSPFNVEFSRIFPGLQQPIIIVFFAIFVFIGVISLLGSYVEIKWRENRNRQIRDRAELHTLKSQIEPHFLFNTLNTITSLIKKNPEKAEEMIIQLSEILQYRSINTKKDCVRLNEEISFTKQYVRLLEARFEKTLKVTWHENFQQSDFKVPVLIFQPLIENCVRHAWQDKNKPLQLNITIHLHDERAHIIVADNGKGIPAQMLTKLPLSNHALANIEERLQVMFRKNNLLHIESVPGEGTTVTIKIPNSCYDQSTHS